jgi:RecJ-like exonuclease
MSARRCGCGAAYYCNHYDGSRTTKWKGKIGCPKCHGTGMVDDCPKCEGCGMLPGSKVCNECGGTAFIMANPEAPITRKIA